MDDAKLPDHVRQRGLELAGEMYFMGRKLTELSREDLLAVAALGWDAERAARKEAHRRAAFAGDMMKAAVR